MAQVYPDNLDGEKPGHSGSVTSLHYNDVAVEAEDVGASRQDATSREVNWIRSKIKMRICRKFVEKVKSGQKEPKDPSDPECFCGYKKSEHIEQKFGPQLSDLEWKVDTHTKATLTNTFGEVEFIGYGENERKYVRVENGTPMDTMLHLLMDIWGLEKPNLLISVTGGAKNFHMKQRLKEVFRRGLMKVAKSTGAWIITGGANMGVMKHVGEAVRDFGLTSANSSPVIAIGVATWGCIQKKEELISPDRMGKYPASYRIESKHKNKETFLDPNHTHFILVDDGTTHQFGKEIPFRASLENAVANIKTDTGEDAVAVPVVLLVLEGGPGTLETVHQAIVNDTPAVIIEGSGRAADILAFAYKNSEEEEIEVQDQEGRVMKRTQTIISASLENQIREMILENFGEKNLVSNLQAVKNSIQKRDLVSVFALGPSVTQDIDIAILKALLKANKDQVFDQLKLALAWNRIDIAKSEIFTDERTWPPGSLDDIMHSAIYLNRIDFVDLFLDNGVSLKEFLTKKRLLQLYNTIPKNNLLHQLLKKERSENESKGKYADLVDVGKLMQSLMGDYYIPCYLKENDYRNLDAELLLDGTMAASVQEPGVKRGLLGISTTLVVDQKVISGNLKNSVRNGAQEFDNPYQELFLWSVLMNRQSLAKLFWQQGKDAIAAALVAFALYDAMAHKTDDCELSKKIKDNRDEFNELSIGVLNECYELDEVRAQNLLIRELDKWGGATCMLIAWEADNKAFISQTACQSLLNSVWMGQLYRENSNITLLTCIVCPPLIFPLIRFKEKELIVDDTDMPVNHNKAVVSLEDTKPAMKKKPSTLTKQHTMLNVHDLDKRTEEEEETSAPTSREYGVFEKFYHFYTAPVIIFVHNVISYLTFLGLYSYAMLVEFNTTVSIVEVILMVWVFSIFAEEVRQALTPHYVLRMMSMNQQLYSLESDFIGSQIHLGRNHNNRVAAGTTKTVSTKLYSYITDTWNIVDVFTIVLFICGIILRFLPYPETLEAARVVLGANLITFFFRILHIFSVHKELGPKLVMIGRMLMDLLYFMIILMVFVVAYAVVAYAILYPYSTFNGDLMVQVMRLGYWNLYGELFLEDIELTEPNCSFNRTAYENDNTISQCPTVVGRYVVPVLMGLYVLFSNILLLNLLIAMFSNTFQKIQDNTDLHWYYQRYGLIYEYNSRPALVPPLIILSHLYRLVKWCFIRCFVCCNPDNLAMFKKFPNERELVQWENVIADTYMQRAEVSELESVENRVLITHQRIETMSVKLEELQEQALASGQLVLHGKPEISTMDLSSQPRPPAVIPPQLERRLGSLENQMHESTKALDWIVKALKDRGMGTGGTSPVIADLRKQKEDEDKVKANLEKELVMMMIEKRKQLHVKSRVKQYPGSVTQRFPVPDEYVLWEVDYPDYSPVVYEAPEVLANPVWADTIQLVKLSKSEREGKIKFNCYDSAQRVSRISYLGPYQIVDGLPRNPNGRTGVIGRGLLGRYGPNHAGDPVVTRWKRDKDNKRVTSNGKYVFEFVAIQRSDNKSWALPGGMCDPGQKVHETLKAEFSEEALGSLITDENHKANIKQHLDLMFTEGVEVYRGYTDDPRNTDNAWMETLVYNYHDDNGAVLHPFVLRAGETVEVASWITASSSLTLHGSHNYYLKLVAERLNAAF